MDTRKTKFVVAFAYALGLVMAAMPRDVAASSPGTIYSFGTIDPDGADPKGSLTYANGFLFGRTTTTTKHGSGDGVIFHFDPNNVGSTYSIDHMFTGHHHDDGDNPRHDAMTPLNGVLYGPRWREAQRTPGSCFLFEN